jgi:hypothetical protein
MDDPRDEPGQRQNIEHFRTFDFALSGIPPKAPFHEAAEFAQVGSPAFIPNKLAATSIHEKQVTRASEVLRPERPIECPEIGRAAC